MRYLLVLMVVGLLSAYCFIPVRGESKKPEISATASKYSVDLVIKQIPKDKIFRADGEKFGKTDIKISSSEKTIKMSFLLGACFNKIWSWKLSRPIPIRGINR